jgi:hypothetical protein
MGFSNPAQPIDYDLIATLVGDVSINYTQVRNACQDALDSTDAAIAALNTLVTSVKNAALDAADVQAVVETALEPLEASISSVSAILSEVQPRPSVPGWSGAREDALAALVAVQLALDAANARADASPEAAAVISDLEDQAAALWTSVKP